MKPFAALVIALFTLLVAVPAASAQSTGLVAAYGFEEPSGTAAVDTSGAGNAGTLAGPTRSASGRFGAALSFDGVNDRVNVADSASLDLAVGMTLEAWVRPNSLNWRTVLLKERPGGLAYALYSSSDNNRPMGEIAASNGGDTRGTAALPGATWSHLATTYDGATLRLFVNGTQVSSRAISGPVAVSSGALRIGGNAVWGEYFNGLIDEVRVYNRALTAGEIQLDMGRAVVASDSEPPSAPSLTASVTSDDIQLSWTASTDDVGVKEYRVYRDGALIGTRTSRTLSDMDRAVGTYRYKVVAVDDAGNVSADSNEAEASVEPDTTPPSVPPAGVCNRTVADYISLRQTFSDDRGPVTLTVKVDGEPVYGPVTGGASGAYFFDWETRGLPNGPHVMTTYAHDGAGNEAVSEPCVWNVHNPEVTIPITSHEDGDTISGNVTFTADVLGDGEPLNRPALILWWSLTPVGGGPGTSGSDNTRPFAFTVGTGMAPDGLYDLKVWTSWLDYFGALAGNTIQVRIHNAPPAPTGVRTEVRDDDVDVLWDPIPGVSTYHVYRDGTKIGTTSGSAFTDGDRPPGTYRYTVSGQRYNAEGPASDEATATVVPPQDTTPPTVTLAVNCDGATVHDYISLRPSFSDDHGPLTVTIEVDGDTIQSRSDLGPTGSFYFDWETRGLSNGPHVMTATARDAAGNESVDQCDWIVHNPEITLPFTSHGDGDTVSGTVVIKAQPLGDGQPITRDAMVVQFAATGPATATDFNYGDREWAWDTTKVPDGLYTVTAKTTWMGYAQIFATNSIQLRVDNPDAPPPPSGLVAAYGFEHTSGTTAADSSGKGGAGTIAGATSVAGGRFGRALSFDGAGDMVTVADSNALDLTPGMTLEAWVKPATVSDWRTVVLKERPGQLAYALYSSTDNGRPMTEIAASTQRDARGTAALPVGTWSHLAATYDGSTLRLFVNGAQVSSTAVGGALFNSTGALRIGGNSVWGEWFSGLIDEVRVYERALSAVEIQADADRPVV